MQLATFTNLVYHMQLVDCRVHQDICDPAGQAVLRGSSLEHYSGFNHIRCALAHSHGRDWVAFLIWRVPDPSLWRPVATGASLGLGPRRSLWLAACELIPQLLDLDHHLSVALPVSVDQTMLAGITVPSLVALRGFVGTALEVLRLLPLVTSQRV